MGFEQCTVYTVDSDTPVEVRKEIEKMWEDECYSGDNTYILLNLSDEDIKFYEEIWVQGYPYQNCLKFFKDNNFTNVLVHYSW